MKGSTAMKSKKNDIFRKKSWNSPVRTPEQVIIDIIKFPKLAINRSIAVDRDYVR